MNCCILIVFISLLSGSVDAGYVKMTKDNQPKVAKRCLILEGSKPQVVCTTDFVVEVSTSKVFTFEVSKTCDSHVEILLGSQKFSIPLEVWDATDAKWMSRRFSIDSNGQTAGIIKSGSSVATPLQFLNSSRYIDVKFGTSSTCAITLIDSVPVLSDHVEANGLSQITIIVIAAPFVFLFICGLIGVVVWKYVTWKKKHLQENQEEKNGRRDSKTGRNRNAQKPVRIAQSL